MMGSRDPQKQLWSYHVNLDKRVRSDHPLRKLNEVLKLDFVREEVGNFYGMKGNVSEDPAVIMKMMLLLFLDNVRSERELKRIIPERLDYMWFLGYGLDDAIPNHSILSKARKRWGQNVFVSLFSRVVAQCVSAGLVDGTKIHVDIGFVLRTVGFLELLCLFKTSLLDLIKGGGVQLPNRVQRCIGVDQAAVDVNLGSIDKPGAHTLCHYPTKERHEHV